MQRVTFRPAVYEVLGSRMSEDLSRHVLFHQYINKCSYKIQHMTSIKLPHVSALRCHPQGVFFLEHRGTIPAL